MIENRWKVSYNWQIYCDTDNNCLQLIWLSKLNNLLKSSCKWKTFAIIEPSVFHWTTIYRLVEPICGTKKLLQMLIWLQSADTRKTDLVCYMAVYCTVSLYFFIHFLLICPPQFSSQFYWSRSRNSCKRIVIMLVETNDIDVRTCSSFLYRLGGKSSIPNLKLGLRK